MGIEGLEHLFPDEEGDLGLMNDLEDFIAGDESIEESDSSA